MLDPANYGSLTITGPVSIEGHGWASIAPVANSAAIIIAANPGDKVNIIGVVLDGTALANTTGILFESGGTLSVRDSVIRNFSDDGIDFAPSSSNPVQLFVSNTVISDNGSTGFYISPAGSGTTTGAIDHVQIENNAGDGLAVITSTETINMTVSDSVSANNGDDGITADSFGGTTVQVMVRNCTIANNAAYGLITNGTGATLSDLVAEIDTAPQGNLSSAIRLFVLDHYRTKTNGHAVESSGQKPLDDAHGSGISSAAAINLQ